MNTVWYALIAFMLIVYVVLDGFDFGAGMVHLFIAKTDPERRAVLGAIGPIWDGNEVWLIAAGGTLVFAFPRAYAAAFSGFYLPLMMVLWLLVLRGVSIEVRSFEPSPLWRSFWDATFALSSAVLALVLGVALGNVVRGVPLDASGYFQSPLFTDFRPGGHPGALDMYTVLVGVYAMTVLAAHGALFLAWQAPDPVDQRAARAAFGLWIAVLAGGVAVTAATAALRPTLFARLAGRPLAWLFLVPIAVGALAVPIALRRRSARAAFVGSAGFIAGMLGATAAGLYPAILPSTIDDRFTLTAASAATGPHTLAIGLAWWLPAVALAIGYFVYLFRSLSGKVTVDEHHY
jgi:cytochrome d ubiquinol oxidase subunit II